MSDLSGLRDAITAGLAAAGIRAYANLPDRLQPPLALVQPGDPYLTPSDTAGYAKGGWTIRHEVVVIVPPGDNRIQTTALDALIEDALAAVIDWGVVQVNQPYTLQVGDAQYLACRIQLVTTK